MAIAKKKTEDREKVNYEVKVLKAKEFDNGISVDLEVNGVKIYNVWHRQYEDRKNPGEEKSFLSFPSRKGNDGKYYSYVWFPVSGELMEEIEAQIGKLI